MNLIDYIPYMIYHQEDYTADILQAMNTEVKKLNLARQDFFLQLNPLTATWALNFYEKDYGIKTDTNKTIEERRSHLIAKMRGKGTTTVEVIKNIAMSFANGEVEVLEHNEEYWIELVFSSQVGIPTNMEDLFAVLEEVKPAHLGLKATVLYNTHDYLSQFPHDFLGEYTHDELRTKKLEDDYEEWKTRRNTHDYLSKFKHEFLANYTHDQLKTKKLDREWEEWQKKQNI